ncbi:MAG TPA: hypothetical protein VHQ46_00810 [Desulfobacteria bacterium]|nr:hypothetical protein [Desulfobacteria bacterium]
MALLQNAPDFLLTPTYDGSGQVVHPSVLDVWTEYGLPHWSGFRYWLAITPYPNGDDAYENPSILASNDGINWVVPPGICNPLDVKPGTKHSTPANYNSDPELVFDPYNSCLLLFWRESLVGNYDRIWLTRIYKNRIIAPKTLCLSVRWSAESLVMSPTIWRNGPNEWYLWTCNGKRIYLHYSDNGPFWRNRYPCTLTVTGGHSEDYVPWHLQVKPNYREHRLEFLICGSPGIPQMSLWYAEASMFKPCHLAIPLADLVLTPSKHKESWDNERIYRSSFVIADRKHSYTYCVWYSARSQEGSWHLGYTEGVLDTSRIVTGAVLQ